MFFVTVVLMQIPWTPLDAVLQLFLDVYRIRLYIIPVYVETPYREL
jgi:hypothetical protein